VFSRQLGSGGLQSVQGKVRKTHGAAHGNISETMNAASMMNAIMATA
jgi:hypothetical protein